MGNCVKKDKNVVVGDNPSRTNPGKEKSHITESMTDEQKMMHRDFAKTKRPLDKENIADYNKQSSLIKNKNGQFDQLKTEMKVFESQMKEWKSQFLKEVQKYEWELKQF